MFGFGKKPCNKVKKKPVLTNPNNLRTRRMCKKVCDSECKDEDKTGCVKACEGRPQATAKDICNWNNAAAAAAKKETAAEKVKNKKKKADEKTAEKARKKGLKEKPKKKKKQGRERDPTDAQYVDDETLHGPTPGRRRRKGRRFTSEPIPDYIMKSLQPKKSVHPEYGKLRY